MIEFPPTSRRRGSFHIGINFDHLHELGGCARVQALLVADFEIADDRPRSGELPGIVVDGGRVAVCR
jgi:hypothetical protein